MIEEELDLSVEPFKSEIIGANKKYIFVRENILSDEYPPCILKIRKPDWNKMCRLWIEGKTQYCLKWNEFCGVMGTFSIEEFKQLGTINVSIDFDEDKEEMIYKDVPLFLVIKFSEIPDFEHG
jgi:hypothetical protein